MAANNILPEKGRELCRVRREGGECRGYIQDVLTEVLSGRDRAILVCPRCQGILKEACTSSRGEQLCSCCKREEEQIHPNVSTRSMVLSLKCSCPLSKRDCGWFGTLGDCENHLVVCNHVFEKCRLGCGEVLQRGQMKLHENDKCVNRKMEVECKLGCGIIVNRDNVTQHMELECGEKEIECPFVNYKCGVGLIKRRKLEKHLEVKRTEHLELKVDGIEEKQNKIIAEHFEKLERYSQEIQLLKDESEKMKKVEKCRIDLSKEENEQNARSLAETLIYRPNFRILEWKIEKIPKEITIPIEKQFRIDGYYFKIQCVWGNGKVLLVKFIPQNGWDYEKLKWPFKAEFITRSKIENSYPSDRYKSEFKTDVIEMGREQFRSRTGTTIATIYEGQLLINNLGDVHNISFEIYVVL